jgi:hypothetical protein
MLQLQVINAKFSPPCLSQSGFEGFVRDRYTLLPETRERIVATEVTAWWRYGTPTIFPEFLFSTSADSYSTCFIISSSNLWHSLLIIYIQVSIRACFPASIKTVLLHAKIPGSKESSGRHILWSS